MLIKPRIMQDFLQQMREDKNFFPSWNHCWNSINIKKRQMKQIKIRKINSISMCRWLMSQFSFEYPFLLGVVLLFIICSIWCKERSRAIFFPHVKTLMAKSAGKSSLLSWLKWIGITAAVVALASPVITKSYSKIGRAHV